MHLRSPVAAVMLMLASCLAPLAVATAQVPAGWCAVSAFHFPGIPGGGVFLLHSNVPGRPVPVTGLPPDLTGGGIDFQGAGSVLVDPNNGDLIVGEHAPFGTLEIHVIRLAGTAVAPGSIAYPIGQVLTWGSIDQMAWRGNDIVFSNRGAAVSGPMAGVEVGILRPSTGTLVPVPFTATLTGTNNALCVDPSGQNAYLARFTFDPLTGAYNTDIYQVPLPNVPGAATTPTLLATVPIPVSNLVFDNAGRLLAMNLPDGYYSIDLGWNPPVVTAVPTPPLGDINGAAMETASGALIAAEGGTGWVYSIPTAGAVVPLGQVAGSPSGVALNPALATYGLATPVANSYTWQIAPNPGGVPTVGNLAFSLTLQSTPGTAPGFLFLSLGADALPVSGCTLLLAQATLVTHGTLPAQSPVTVPLVIPAAPSLEGWSVYAQTGHFEPNGIASSNGLRLTIF